jgi:hypothetical protein
MADKDTSYFELRDALQAGGCALCHLGRKAAARYLETLNYEGVNDPALRQALRAARGLCQRHAWQLTRLRGSPLGVALIYRSIINDLIEVLESQGPVVGRRPGDRRALAARLGAAKRCPACRVEEEAAERASQTLLAHLGEPEIAPAYATAGGLCLSHLRGVLAQADEAQARTLQAWQLAVYQNLRKQLSEFIRKHDHRFRDEPFGDEAHSWIRAVASLVGERGIE